MSDAALTGATVEVRIGDRHVKLKALTDRQIVELDEWVRQRIMHIALASLPDRCTPALQDCVIQNALKVASGASWLNPEGRRVLHTIDGLTMLLFK